MKIFFWISLCLPLAVMAQDIDYFAPKDIVSTPETKEKTIHEGWGQGVLGKLEKLQMRSADTKTTSTKLSPEYLQQQLRIKATEIAQVRQQLGQTTDGQKIQSLTGTLHRLESEHQRIVEGLKTTGSATLPTDTVIPTEMGEEEALKMQVDRLTQEEAALTKQLKSTTDANTLSTLGSQLERTQQNKSLAALSLRDVQRRNLENSTSGFGAMLLPPDDKEIPRITTPQSLTPSLEQVAPPVLPTVPWPAGWGKINQPVNPTATPAPIAPTGTPVTGQAWHQVHTQATAALGGISKPEAPADTHAAYDHPKKPLWTHTETLAHNRKSVPHHAPVDHKHIVEKIRKEKLFS